MKNTRISISLKGLIILLAIILMVAAFFLFKAIVTSQPNFIENCTQAKARHLTNIPKGSVYYRPSLDKDSNGFACET